MLKETTTGTKVVVFSESQAERDFLRRHLAGRNFTILYFEEETICFGNLKSIDPTLVILRTDLKSSVWRFIFAAYALELNTSLLIISDVIQSGFFTKIVERQSLRCITNRQLLSHLDQCIDQLIDQNHNQKQKKNIQFTLDQPIIIGESQAIQKVWSTLPSLKLSRDPVLITGEAGTGKELLARAIVACTESDCSFIKIDCSELDRQTVAHNNLVRPAVYDHVLGNIKANGSSHQALTIFLQRVDSLDEALQLEILMLIDDIHKIGTNGSAGALSKVRFIATARPGLEDKVRQTDFRKDLFYRLNVIPIALPPLRERKEDIDMLADYFMIAACARMQKSFRILSMETKQLLDYHDWPGNVDEMYKLIQRIAASGDESIIFSSNCIPDCKKQAAEFNFHTNSLAVLPDTMEIKNVLNSLKNISLKTVCDKFIAKTEKKLMQKALESTNWNRKKAAALLNISYKSMLNKMKMYEIV